VELRLEEGLILTLPIEELRKQRGFGQEGVDQHRQELVGIGRIEVAGTPQEVGKMVFLSSLSFV